MRIRFKPSRPWLASLASGLLLSCLSTQAQSTLTNGLVAYWNFDQKNFKDSKKNYLALTDTMESTVSQSSKSAAELLADIDSYRRLRDMSFLALLAWHGLTIIDANVDAHFFNWDVSEDLSLRIQPRALWVGRMKPGVALSLILNNK